MHNASPLSYFLIIMPVGLAIFAGCKQNTGMAMTEVIAALIGVAGAIIVEAIVTRRSGKSIEKDVAHVT